MSRATVISASLSLLCLVTFGRAVGQGFVNWDDQGQLYENPDFNPPSLHKLARYWRGPHMNLYLPVTYSVWGAVAAVAYDANAPGTVKLRAGWFHATNLLLHVVATVLVFLILRSIVGEEIAAGIGAAVFGVHPLQVEAVAWASAMYTVLSGALSLGAIWLYLRFARGGKKLYVALSTLAYVLAMGAKPSAVVVPLVIVVIEVTLLRRPVRRWAPLMAIWLLAAVAIVIVARHFQRALIVPDTPIWQRPIVAMDAIGFYLSRLIDPIELVADYGRKPQRVMQDPWAIATCAATVAVVIAAIIFFRRAKWGLAAVAIIVAALAPFLGLVRFDFQWFSTVADRYFYLSMLGVALAVAGLVCQVKRVALIAPTAIALLAVFSFGQVGYWRDTTTLFERTRELNPDSLVAHNVLAYLAMQHGDRVGAEAHYRAALRTRPDDPAANYNLGNLLLQESRAPEAQRHFMATTQKTPGDARGWNGLGVSWRMMGDEQSARVALERAVGVDPNNAEAQANLGMVYVVLGDESRARVHLNEALRLDPKSKTARLGLQRLGQQ